MVFTAILAGAAPYFDCSSYSSMARLNLSSSHYCPSAIHSASEHQIVLFALPPNTTHLTQLLDKGIFGPLKIEWRKVCHDYIIENPGKVVTQHCFSELFAKAWIRSMTMRNILAEFHNCGVYPIDRSKVISRIEPPSTPQPKVGGGLTYFPFLTPAPCQDSCRVLKSILYLHFLMPNLSCILSDLKRVTKGVMNATKCGCICTTQTLWKLVIRMLTP